MLCHCRCVFFIYKHCCMWFWCALSKDVVFKCLRQHCVTWSCVISYENFRLEAILCPKNMHGRTQGAGLVCTLGCASFWTEISNYVTEDYCSLYVTTMSIYGSDLETAVCFMFLTHIVPVRVVWVCTSVQIQRLYDWNYWFSSEILRGNLVPIGVWSCRAIFFSVRECVARS